MTAVAFSRRSLTTHGRTFALAARFLPRRVADDAAILYAWCRRADDAVDLAPASAQPERARALRLELDGIYAGAAQSDPVSDAFQRLVRERRIPKEYPDGLVAGIEMDANGTRYVDTDALVGYCFRVAGTVGLMMSHVLEVRRPEALRHAAHLGIAMQLTNICRDVGEDFARGRLYLPASLLARAGAHIAAHPGGELPEAAREPIATVVRSLLAYADAFYESGERGIPFLPFRAAAAVRAARLVYAEIGRVVLRRGADPLAPRATVSAPRKLVLVVRAALETLPFSGRRFEATRPALPMGSSDVVRS
jgi:phytoene synthase